MMKRYYSLWAFIALLCMMACSKGEDDVTVLPSDDGTDEEEFFTDSMNYEHVKTLLLSADTLSPGTIKYTMRNGEMLDNARPGVYSVGIDSMQASRAFFYSYCVPVGQEQEVMEKEGKLIYDMGDYGCCSYTEENRGDLMASIDIELFGVDEVNRMEFIPKAMWPNNEGSPFKLGDIVTDKEHGWWWLCVREWASGQKGILMTFDGGWSDENRSDHYKSYTKRNGCAAQDAWDALAHLYMTWPNDFKATYLSLREKYEKIDTVRIDFWWIHQTFTYDVGEARKLRSFLRQFINNPNSSIEYQSGNTSDSRPYDWRTVRYLWKATTNYVKVGINDIEWIDGMPRFKSGSYSFSRKDDPKLPSCWESHSCTFTLWDKDKYDLKYPLEDW